MISRPISKTTAVPISQSKTDAVIYDNYPLNTTSSKIAAIYQEWVKMLLLGAESSGHLFLQQGYGPDASPSRDGETLLSGLWP